MEYLIVHFPLSRRVMIDDEFHGRTEELIEVEVGKHRVSLSPPSNFTPAQQTIVLKDTSALEPHEVSFDLASEKRTVPETRTIAVHVQQGDALKIRTDVLALKYAQSLHGVDAQAVDKLKSSGWKPTFPTPWDARLVEAGKGIAASKVLFVGVPPLREFSYREIRTFARKVLASLTGEAPETKHVSLTLHGPGYGLDEVEAFEAEVAGLIDAVRSGDIPETLEKITFVEWGQGRAQRRKELLKELLPRGRSILNYSVHL